MNLESSITLENISTGFGLTPEETRSITQAVNGYCESAKKMDNLVLIINNAFKSFQGRSDWQLGVSVLEKKIAGNRVNEIGDFQVATFLLEYCLTKKIWNTYGMHYRPLFGPLAAPLSDFEWFYYDYDDMTIGKVFELFDYQVQATDEDFEVIVV